MLASVALRTLIPEPPGLWPTVTLLTLLRVPQIASGMENRSHFLRFAQVERPVGRVMIPVLSGALGTLVTLGYRGIGSRRRRLRRYASQEHLYNRLRGGVVDLIWSQNLSEWL